MSTGATEVAATNRVPAWRNLGFAWIALCLALAAHVTDEALAGFLSVYNPAVLAWREKLGFWPMPTFTFGEWLTGLVVAVVLLLSRSVFQGARWIRPRFYWLAIIMLGNGLAPIAGPILGHTVSAVRCARPMPGFYSSPLLLPAAGYALVRLWRTRRLIPVKSSAL